jgi:hypothetical protein
MSPPETKAISERSGERLGSAKLGTEATAALPLCDNADVRLANG